MKQKYSHPWFKYAFVLIGFILNYKVISMTYCSSIEMRAHGLIFFISFCLGLFLLQWFTFELIHFFTSSIIPYLVVLQLNFLSAFAMHKYNILIDKDLILSLSSTNSRELGEYINVPAILFLVFSMGVVLVMFIYRRLLLRPVNKKIWLRAVSLMGVLILFVANILLFYKEYSFFLRQHKAIKHQIVPLNHLDGSLGAILKVYRQSQQKFIDQTSGVYLLHQENLNHKKNLIVLIVGETARAQNFAINGYQRETNPRLSKNTDIINFSNTHSCGTSTAVSVPCMFDPDGHNAKSRTGQVTNLLDYIEKVGFEVYWVDNNTGCQGVCNRVHVIEPHKSPESCDHENCYDVILLDELKRLTHEDSPNKFIVLHMLGSHGPRYFQRYSKNFKKFQPACEGLDLSSCTQQEVINAYDNTIVYTDYVVSEVLAYLKNLKGVNVSMTYISDHGESLGENGIYLHAMPMIIAPDEQTRVPFIFWANGDFYKTWGVDKDCLLKSRQQSVSHDNVFHSYLGLLGIRHKVYKPQNDIFKQCQI